jgi:hypothetical protein
MPSNDYILLESTLSLAKKDSGTNLPESDYFEAFVCEQILKDVDVSNDELLEGIIDGGDDGGVDAFYALVNGELLDADTELDQFPRNSQIELYIIQAKQGDSFGEQAFDRLISTSSDIFDLAKTLKDFEKHYNSGLMEKVAKFRAAYLQLSSRHARLSIRCYYATKGDTKSAHPKVIHKQELLKAQLEKFFHGTSVFVELMGARELLSAAQKQRSYTLQLKLVENPISTGEGAYVALASLTDYAAFVTDERGSLRKYIFESNVRDYQGDVDVNEDIRKTLEEEESALNFWWLNNGVTILASKATIAGKIITIDDVQVVNGLQTTTSIYNYIRGSTGKTDSRSVLVRIIESTDSEARDRIIKATNHQTAIPSASLKATDRIQRDIESFLQTKGWYYDRRKNYYKNLGKPAYKIVSIPYLAQAVMAIVLQQPDYSRARPSTLIKNDSDYRRVFSDLFDLDIYRACVELMREVDLHIRYFYSPDRSQSNDDARNLRFHIAMVFAIKLLGKLQYKPNEVQRILPILEKEGMDSILAEDSVTEVLALLGMFREDTDYSTDRIAKSREFVLVLLEQVTPGLSSLTPERTAVNEKDSLDSKLGDDDIPF